MIEILPKDQYFKVKHLFEERSYVNSFFSHLERTPIPKRVYVDDLENPQTAVIFVIPRLFLGGKSDNDEFNSSFKQLIQDELIPEYKTRKYTEIDFYISNDEWQDKLSEVFEDSFLYDRYYYEIRQVKHPHWREMIPEGFTIEPVDLSLLEKNYLENYDWLIEEIEENWLPFEEGLKECRGYYLVHENKKIVSWCTTEYLTDNSDIEVGIATRSEYQKKGLATIVGSATAELALLKYKSVGWHCGQRNVSSWKLAEKIGFERIREYRKGAIIINKVDEWVVKGYYKMLEKRYEETIEFYRKIIEAAELNTEDYIESYYLHSDFPIELVHFRISTYLTAIGEINQAIKHLKIAFNLGFTDTELLLTNELLKPLQNTKEWKEVLEIISEINNQ